VPVTSSTPTARVQGGAHGGHPGAELARERKGGGLDDGDGVAEGGAGRRGLGADEAADDDNLAGSSGEVLA
jgi:hypothetical protein